MKEIEFAAGAENDPYGFKPTDVVVDRDGSLLVSDWADGQRPKRGRGRIYRIRYEGQPSPNPAEPARKSQTDWIAQLDAPGLHRRVEAQAAIEQQGNDGLNALQQAMGNGKVEVPGRLHAVWILAKAGGRESTDELFKLAEKDPDARVRAQAVRALADLCDPVLVQHRLAAGPGDSAHAARLAAMGKSADQRVLLEVILALGRMQWPQAPDWHRENLKQPDAALAHAAMQTLRRSKNWPAVLTLVDQPDSSPLRAIALRAIAGQADTTIVDGLRQRFKSDPDPLHRKEYADALTRIHRLPGPWVYWDYRPRPRPVNTVSWEQTTTIEQVLDGALADADHGVRTATLRRMQSEQIPVRLETLERWLRSERDADSVTAIVDSLRDRPAELVRDLFESVILEQTHSTNNRLAVLELFLRGLDAASQGRLLDLAAALDDGPVLAKSLRELGSRPQLSSRTLLRSKLMSPVPEVRVAALESIAALQDHEAAESVLKLLQDTETRVRHVAALAAGRLEIREAIEPLLLLANDPDALVRRECLDALRRLHEPRVVPLAQTALQDAACQLVALDCLADLAGPAQLDAVALLGSRSYSVDVLQSVVRVLSRWEQNEANDSPVRARLEEAVARMHASSGLLLRWAVTGPLSADEATRILRDSSKAPETWKIVFTSGTEARVELSSPANANPNDVWLAIAEVSLTEPADVQFLGSGTGMFGVWLNGRQMHQRAAAGVFLPDSDRFDARLERGPNRIAVQVPARDGARFHLRFRRKSSNAGHEHLTQLALTTTGNAARGREVFFNAEKSLCLRCHPFGDKGVRVGPDLTGVGARFPRIHLIESILEPNRTIAPSFEYMTVELNDGGGMLGVKVSETRDTLIMGDLQGQHEIRKDAVKRMQPLPLSLMPEGLEKSLSEKEFVDLIAFLLEQE